MGKRKPEEETSARSVRKKTAARFVPDPALENLPGVKKMGKPARYKMIVKYDGKGFHGWQKQHPGGEDPLRTVQEVLEATVRGLLAQKLRCHPAGRTDSGVRFCLAFCY